MYEKEANECAREIFHALRHHFVRRAPTVPGGLPQYSFVHAKLHCEHALFKLAVRDRWDVDAETWKSRMPSINEVVALCRHTESVLAKEPTLVTIDHSSCYIVGDIHGNYHVCTNAHKRALPCLGLTAR